MVEVESVTVLVPCFEMQGGTFTKKICATSTAIFVT